MKLDALKQLFVDALKKEYRSKTFIVLIIFTVLIVLVSKILLDFVQHTAEKQAAFAGQLIGSYSLNIFYTFIDMWAAFIATLIGVNTLRSDQAHKVGVQFLSLPIRRETYLASRFLGSWFIVTCYYLFSLVFAGVLFSLSSDQFLLGGHFLLALLNSSLMVFGTLIFAMGFSLFLPRMMAFVANLMFIGLLSLSNGKFFGDSFSEMTSQLGIGSGFLFVCHWIFPRIANLSNFTNKVLYQSDSLPIGAYLFTLGHFLIFALLWGWLFSLSFNKRDL